MSIKVITTNDGSKSLFVPQINETYHSKFGAKTESLHVFIQSGFDYVFRYISNRRIHILEIGFGTGLNAFLTFCENAEKYGTVYYESIEKYPLPDKIIKQLNYTTTEEEQYFFDAIHQAEWDKTVVIAEHFCLHKRKTDLLEFQSEKKFDLVYFDAFAPDKQPELWTLEVFEKLYNLMQNKGILVTYSAKGQVRRNMQAAGFTVTRIPGPPGKREMLRAVKNKF